MKLTCLRLRVRLNRSHNIHQTNARQNCQHKRHYQVLDLYFQNLTPKFKIRRVKPKSIASFGTKKRKRCGKAEFAKFSKAAVHGVINTSWTLKKADNILNESREIGNALKHVPKSWLSGNAAGESTLQRNIERLEKARKDIASTEESLTTIRLKIIDIRNSSQAVPAELKVKVKELEGVILPSQLANIVRLRMHYEKQ